MGLLKSLLNVAVKAASDKISSEMKNALGVNDVKPSSAKTATPVSGQESESFNNVPPRNIPAFSLSISFLVS